MAYVFTLPESPRFLLQRAIKKQESKQQSREVAKLVRKAYQALIKFNKTELQATRELIITYHSLKKERMHRTSQAFKAISELWTHPRTRYAMYASVTVMFLQQFCGINVLAYYSTTLIHDALAEDLTSSLPSKASRIHSSLGNSENLQTSVFTRFWSHQFRRRTCRRTTYGLGWTQTSSFGHLSLSCPLPIPNGSSIKHRGFGCSFVLILCFLFIG